MAVPSSVKFTKNGVEYLNNVDRVNFTIQELTRMALKDTGRFVLRIVKQKFYSAFKKRSGRTAVGLGYWVRRRETDLVIGAFAPVKGKVSPWWFMFQEFGTEQQPKLALLQSSVTENLDEIQKIQAQYLSALNNEQEALSLIDEVEELTNDEV